MLKNAPSLLQDRFRRELLTLQQWEQTQMLATLQRIATIPASKLFVLMGTTIHHPAPTRGERVSARYSVLERHRPRRLLDRRTA